MIVIRKIIKSTPAAIRGLILFSILLILYSCSSGLSSIYSCDYPLTDKTVKSNSSLVEVYIPKGWFVADDNERNLTDLWLIKDDYSATIKFVMISVAEDGTRNVPSSDLERIFELNKLVIKTRLGKSFKGFSEEAIENGSQRFLAFQYLDQKNQPVRTILMRLGDKYYEINAYALASPNPEEIFQAQNSVLASLK